MKRIIYDFGANNGDDIPYYLQKADLVVAVEANPTLCTSIRNRFQTAIGDGKLVVENYVLTNKETTEDVTFYLHKENHVLSQFPKPDKETITEYSRIDLSAVTPITLINKYGQAYYIKIDIEHFDGEILRCLFDNEIYPEYISAESHDPEIFSLLVASGGYDAFKLVDGRTVAETYHKAPIRTLDGSTRVFSFPHHSAGPFGDDVDGEWLSGKSMLRKLGFHGCGWKDLHATNNRKGTSDFSMRNEIRGFYTQKFLRRLRRLKRIFLK